MMTRNGTTLVEVTVAGILAATIIGATLQFLGALRDTRGSTENRVIAIQHARNVAERLSVWKYEQLDEGRFKQLVESELSDNRLPGGRIQIRLSPETDLEALRIEIKVDWLDRTGQAVTPVRVTLWRHDVGDL